MERQPTDPSSGAFSLPRLVMVGIIYAIPILVAVRPVADPVLDPDIWWHLRVGQWIVEHHTVPLNDPFTLFGQERFWVAYSWLYEVIVYGLYQAFGLAGIVLYRTVMALTVVASVHALVRRLEQRFLVATGLTVVAVLAIAILFSERPWLFTVLFSTLTLNAVVALRRPDATPRWVWLLPLVFVLWANVHIQFIYGLLLLGLGCVAPWFDRQLGLGQPDDTASLLGTNRWRQLVALSGLCFVGTLVNPYHVRLYGVVVEYATQPGPFLWVNELKALEFREASDWVMLAMVAGACFALGSGKRSTFEILLLAGGAILAFRARRDIWFAVLGSLIVLGACGPREVAEEQRVRFSVVARGLLLLGLLVVASVRATVQDLSPSGLQARIERRFPVVASQQIRERGYAGPIYNDFNWGGYVIWALPNLPAAIDGRTNLHGDERIERFGRVWSGMAGWQNDPDLCQAGVILGQADSALVSLLRLDPRYRLVYEDEIACVFIPYDRQR